MQFDGMVYQQIVGIPMGINCAPLIADLFLYTIICLFRNAVGPEEKFGLDRVRITESFMVSLKD